MEVRAVTRRCSPLALLSIIVAAAAMATASGAQDAQAASYVWCNLSARDQDPPGGTSAYNLTVQRRNTSCATAKKVMVGFHRCRTDSGYRCARNVLQRWHCAGRRDSGTPTFRGSFTCMAAGRRVKGAYLQDTPTCFGGAARDPKRPCFNPARSVSPPLGADPDMSWVCDPGFIPGACLFGFLDEPRTRGYFAVVGDSHVLHWRAALGTVAQVKRWRGYSLSAGGCFFSAAARLFLEHCEGFYRETLAWFAAHPEVSTVFVTSNADTPVTVAPGQTYLGVKVDGFRRAWQALPKTVKHVVVIRDATISSQATLDCVTQAIAAGTRRLASACPLPRSVALRPDAGVATVQQLRSPRYQSVDLTRFMCGDRNCYPVVGGTAVNQDIYGHLNTTFTRTLGPYLLRELRTLMASW